MRLFPQTGLRLTSHSRTPCPVCAARRRTGAPKATPISGYRCSVCLLLGQRPASWGVSFLEEPTFESELVAMCDQFRHRGLLGAHRYLYHL